MILFTQHIYSHYDPEHVSFGCLRILNEDRIEACTGFDFHPHREFEIFTYVVGGEMRQ